MHTPSASAKKRSAESFDARARETAETGSGRKRRKTPYGRASAAVLPHFQGENAEEERTRHHRQEEQEEAGNQATARRDREVYFGYRRRHQQSPPGGVEDGKNCQPKSGGGNKPLSEFSPRFKRTKDRSRPTLPRVEPQAVQREKRTRRMLCGLQSRDCGWVTPDPGVKCNKCPGDVVHSAEEKLCAACHRSAGESKTFVHLREVLLRRAVGFVVQLRDTGRLPPVLVNGFLPSSACLCRRADCFHAFLKDLEESRRKRICVGCGGSYSGRKKTKWYLVATEDEDDGGEEGGAAGLLRAGSWCCRACFQLRRSEKSRLNAARHPKRRKPTAATAAKEPATTAPPARRRSCRDGQSFQTRHEARCATWLK